VETECRELPAQILQIPVDDSSQAKVVQGVRDLVELPRQVRRLRIPVRLAEPSSAQALGDVREATPERLRREAALLLCRDLMWEDT